MVFVRYDSQPTDIRTDDDAEDGRCHRLTDVETLLDEEGHHHEYGDVSA